MGQYADDEIARQQEEMFGITREPTLKQQKKLDALSQLTKLSHIAVSSNNGGVHLMIQGTKPGQRVDFWPSTGLWRIPGNPQRGWGVPALIAHLNNWKEV